MRRDWNVSIGSFAGRERVHYTSRPFSLLRCVAFWSKHSAWAWLKKWLFWVQRGRGEGGFFVGGDGCTYGALLCFTSSDGIPCRCELYVGVHVVLVVIGVRGVKE